MRHLIDAILAIPNDRPKVLEEDEVLLETLAGMAFQGGYALYNRNDFADVLSRVKIEGIKLQKKTINEIADYFDKVAVAYYTLYEVTAFLNQAWNKVNSPKPLSADDLLPLTAVIIEQSSKPQDNLSEVITKLAKLGNALDIIGQSDNLKSLSKMNDALKYTLVNFEAAASALQTPEMKSEISEKPYTDVIKEFNRLLVLKSILNELINRINQLGESYRQLSTGWGHSILESFGSTYSGTINTFVEELSNIANNPKLGVDEKIDSIREKVNLKFLEHTRKNALDPEAFNRYVDKLNDDLNKHHFGRLLATLVKQLDAISEHPRLSGTGSHEIGFLKQKPPKESKTAETHPAYKIFETPLLKPSDNRPVENKPFKKQ